MEAGRASSDPVLRKGVEMPHAHDTVEANGKNRTSAREGSAIVRTIAPARKAQASREPEVKNGWLDFDLPDGADEKTQSVYASIRNVHRQAYVDLALLGRFRWNGYASVESKLTIAATALQHGATAQAEALVEEARATYKEQLAAQRKVAYLVGVGVGIGVLALLQLALHRSTDALTGVITEQFALQMVIFAGMGTLASVLTRIGQFKVETYATRSLVVISGASRPLVAAFVAFAAYAFLRSDLATVTVNGTNVSDVQNATYIYLSAAFLCGFSERFGRHVIDQASSAFGSAAAST
jgi:hypothetical protein